MCCMSATSVLPHSVLATSLAHHSRAVHSKAQAKICGDTAAVTLVTTLAASAASFRRADALESPRPPSSSAAARPRAASQATRAMKLAQSHSAIICATRPRRAMARPTSICTVPRRTAPELMYARARERPSAAPTRGSTRTKYCARNPPMKMGMTSSGVAPFPLGPCSPEPISRSAPAGRPEGRTSTGREQNVQHRAVNDRRHGKGDDGVGCLVSTSPP